MPDALAHALVEAYVNAVELLAVALRIVRARPEGDPAAEEILRVCREAADACRAFRRHAPGHLPFLVARVREQFAVAEELLRALGARGHPVPSDVTAAVEIAERGRAAAEASARLLSESGDPRRN